jgi:hypothetical protein
MRLLGLAAIYQRPNTSKPAAAHKIYPYLLRGLAIEPVNQVWCCHGPLTKGAPSGGEMTTPFFWAAASKHGDRPGLRAAPAPQVFDVLVANSREQLASCISLSAGGRGIQNRQP